MSFHKAAIAKLAGQARTSKKQLELSDPQEPGLRVRAGSRSVNWILNCRLANGKRTRIKLGSWPAMSIAEARVAAQKQRHEVLNGSDPNAERRKAALQAKIGLASKVPLGEVLDRYDAAHLSKLRRGAATRRALDGERGLLAPFIRLPIDEVAESDLREAVRHHALSSPMAANRNLAYTKAFFNWCRLQQILDKNPAQAIPKPVKERPRERYHTVKELAAIWAAALQLGYPFSPLVRLLIAMPMRREEVASMEIGELEFDRNVATVWTLPASRTKTTRALRIPLSSLASQVIQEAIEDEARPLGSRYIFSTTGDTPVSGFSKAKRRLDTLITASGATMAHWTIHDLRTTFATLASDELGIQINVADRMLNHVASSTSSKIERTYNRSELFAERREASRKWAGFLEEHVLTSRKREKCFGEGMIDGSPQASFNF